VNEGKEESSFCEQKGWAAREAKKLFFAGAWAR